MDAQGFVAAAPLVGLVINMVLHVSVSHARPSLGFIARAALGLLGGAVATGAMSIIGLAGQPVSPLDAGLLALLGIVTYLALGFGYFNFVNLNVTSLRIRLLRELLDRHPEGLVRDEIVRHYGAQTVLRLRLERLIGAGHVVCREDRYYTGRRGVLFIAHFFTLLRRIVIPSRPSPSAAQSHA